MSQALPKNVKLCIVFLLIMVGHLWLAFFIKREETYLLFTAFALLFAVYTYCCRQQLTDRQLWFFIAGSFALRFIWLPAFPSLSDDYARFVWDGRLIAHGYNPFKYLPANIIRTGSPMLMDAHLYSVLNSQTYYTCYPPMLQVVFGISAKLAGDHLIANMIILKSFNVLAEIGTILLLTKLLPLWKIGKECILLYALNPVVIAELSGNLHYEGMMNFFLIALIYALSKGRFLASILLFTCAVITKLVPLMFLPLFLFYYKGGKGILFCTGVLVLTMLSFLPFLDLSVIHKFWSSIDSYFQESEYNASIYYLVRNIAYHVRGENEIEIIGPCLTLFSGFLILVLVFIKRKAINERSLPVLMSCILLIYYLFTTTVFPWYLSPMIAFSVFTKYKFPLVWSAVIVLSYYTDRNTQFEESSFLLWVEYIFVGIAIIWDLSRIKQQKRSLLQL